MKKFLHYTIFITALIGIDQITKHYFINYFESSIFKKEIIILPFFKFVYVWNKGVSFGMFSHFEYSNIIFLVLSSLICIIIAYLLFKSKFMIESLSYSLIIGGAIGNICDRIKHGAVFDFLDVHINEYHFPVFNVADGAVSIGVILFLANLIYHEKTGKV